MNRILFEATVWTVGGAVVLHSAAGFFHAEPCFNEPDPPTAYVAGVQPGHWPAEHVDEEMPEHIICGRPTAVSSGVMPTGWPAYLPPGSRAWL